jgi:hypothetical protein
MLSVYAECLYSECLNAEFRYAECMLSVVASYKCPFDKACCQTLTQMNSFCLNVIDILSAEKIASG